MYENHVSPNLCDQKGNSLVAIGTKVGAYEIVKYLLDAGGDPNIPNVLLLRLDTL